MHLPFWVRYFNQITSEAEVIEWFACAKILHLEPCHTLSRSDSRTDRSMATTFDIDAARKHFPALSQKQVFFDVGTWLARHRVDGD